MAYQMLGNQLEAEDVVQDTFIKLTNDYPGEVRFQMYFVNGDAPTAP